MSQHSNHICPECGKYIPFSPTYGWGYAINGKYTCSYHCMRAMRARDEGGLPGGPYDGYGRKIMKRLTEEEIEKIPQYLAGGESVRTIAGALGVSENAIRKQMKKHGWMSPETQKPEEKPQKEPEVKPEPSEAAAEPATVLTAVEEKTSQGETVQLLAIQLMSDIVKLIREILKD